MRHLIVGDRSKAFVPKVISIYRKLFRFISTGAALNSIPGSPFFLIIDFRKNNFQLPAFLHLRLNLIQEDRRSRTFPLVAFLFPWFLPTYVIAVSSFDVRHNDRGIARNSTFLNAELILSLLTTSISRKNHVPREWILRLNILVCVQNTSFQCKIRRMKYWRNTKLVDSRNLIKQSHFYLRIIDFVRMI